MFIGIDCGTQGTKAVVLDPEGKILGIGHAAHQIIEHARGTREQDPQWWIDAAIIAVRGALDAAGIPGDAVRAIGVSGQQHGLVPLDANGKVLRPAKLWNDTETAPQNEEMVRRMGGAAACEAKIGLVPLTGYTLSKVLWLKENAPEAYDQLACMMLPHDYLNFWLTGRRVAEYGDASGTAYFDIRKRAWSEDVLALIDDGTGKLASCLPELIAADDVVGTLTAEAAEALGLTTRCIVSAGGGDNMMGAIGTGNLTEGVVTLSIGTSAAAYTHSDTPVTDPQGRVAAFCSSDGAWLPLVCMMNATGVTTKVASVLGHDVTAIDRALAASPAGAEGLTVLPFLNGERTPDLPTATGTVLGLSMVNLTQDNLLRAVTEGVTFGMLAGLSLILSGRATSAIHLVGGGAKSPQWRQMIADATGATVLVPLSEEAGALGGALQAQWAWQKYDGHPMALSELAKTAVAVDASKTAEPRPSVRADYDEAFARYRKAVLDIHGVDVI
ncbi:xylulokinase [Tropicimonas isoalkanivorans]|uniref:Xylulose kinase n=1 Tax=Tropicimonas isoalkanivorans TaxID=441112 RepID=A0A1I1ICY0_9RHOB|nr:xylulokinase [Tropicimonas isoalkanivorans]SFC33975.1 xylulokinase [Tropicimonas isoalkanivorans]